VTRELRQQRAGLDWMTGFVVADARGRLVGRVEGTIDGASQQTPDVLSVRSRLFSRRRRLVPVDTIDAIDARTRVVGLRIERSAIEAFS
jgi:hypothetical protein